VKYLRSSIIGIMFSACTLSLPLAADSDGGFIHLTPEQITFKSPAGFQQTILVGDPSKAGIYVVRVRFPPGVHSNPHYHSQDRYITVMKGTWYMGTGEKAEFDKAVPLKAGSFAVHPAHGVHWDGAGSEETIVQIVGMGPVETVPVDPKAPGIGQWPVNN